MLCAQAWKRGYHGSGVGQQPEGQIGEPSHPLPSPSIPLGTQDWAVQNYLIWRRVLDRISSLSQRFKEARASYRKVSDTPPLWLSPYAKPGLPLVPL